MPDARESEEKVPSGEFSNVMLCSVPSAETAASKFAAAAIELGALARDPAPSSAPVNKTNAACAGAAMAARASVVTPANELVLLSWSNS